MSFHCPTDADRNSPQQSQTRERRAGEEDGQWPDFQGPWLEIRLSSFLFLESIHTISDFLGNPTVLCLVAARRCSYVLSFCRVRLRTDCHSPQPQRILRDGHRCRLCQRCHRTQPTRIIDVTGFSNLLYKLKCCIVRLKPLYTHKI